MRIATPYSGFDKGLAWARAGLDLILPPRCLSCREIVPEPGRVCAPCWNQIPFLAGSQCRFCAKPLEAAASDEPVCERCAFEPPVWQRAVAALRYDGMARRMILRFKHGDRIEASELFADWLAMPVRSLVTPDTLILPVPMHRWRLVARGYNQTVLLGRPLAKKLGCGFDAHLLRKQVSTQSQQGMGAQARLMNAKADHYIVTEPQRVFGRSVLLVDDVLTTGATMGAVARTLLDAGAAQVDVAALARVVQDE